MIGVLNSAVSAYYYLRVLVVMYMDPEKSPFAKPPEFSGALFTNVLMGALVIIVGLFPGVLLAVIMGFYRAGIQNPLPPLF